MIMSYIIGRRRGSTQRFFVAPWYMAAITALRYAAASRAVTSTAPGFPSRASRKAIKPCRYGWRQRRPRLLAIGAFDMFRLEKELAVDHRRMPFGSADQQRNRIGHIIPGGRQRADYAVLESQQSFAGFIAAGIDRQAIIQLCRGQRHIAHQPQQDIQRMGAQIAETRRRRRFLDRPSTASLTPDRWAFH